MVLASDDSAVLLDWDEACRGPLVYDLACSMVGGCFEGAQLLPERVSTLLDAYRECRSLSEEELAALPVLMQANAIITAWYRWRAFHIEVPDAPAEAKESFREMVGISLGLDPGGAARKALIELLK